MVWLLGRPSFASVLKALACSVICATFLMTADAGTTSYTYDVHGRLKTVSTPIAADTSTTTYTLDDAGNRTAVVTTFIDVTRPNPPASLTAQALDYRTIRLTWPAAQDVGGGAVAFYKIYRGGQLWAQPNATTFDDFPLTANTSYSYVVSAVDTGNNESIGNPSASATTPSAPPGPDTTPPSDPGNLHTTAVGGTSVSLAWNVSVDNLGGAGLAGYEVFRNGASIGTTSSTGYTDGGLTPVTTYQYKVRAYDLAVPANPSGFSNEISVPTLDTIAPSAPGNPMFSSITGGTASASWGAATDNVGVTGYRYSLNGGASWTDPATSPVSLTGLTASTNYTMLVQARDAAGNWSVSSSASFLTANTYTDSLQFTVGDNGGGVAGYWQGAYGALSPSNSLSYGKAINQYTSAVTVTCTSPVDCTVNWATYLVVSGFSANPGATWLQSLSGSGLTGANAASFTYNAGGATWYWPAPAVPGSGTTVTLIVVHSP